MVLGLLLACIVEIEYFHFRSCSIFPARSQFSTAANPSLGKVGDEQIVEPHAHHGEQLCLRIFGEYG